MKHGFPFFIGEVISFEIPTHRYTSISKLINDEPETDSGYKMERKASKSFLLMSPSDIMVGRARGHGCRAGQIGLRSMSGRERRNIGGRNTRRCQPIHSVNNGFDRVSIS